MQGNKKKIAIIAIVVLLVVGIIIGVSYAWWTNTATQSSINKITSDCLSLTITDINNSAINLEYAYPITNAEASLLTPYTFTVTNTCNNNAEYSVQLEIMNLGDKQLGSQYLSMNFNNEGKKRMEEYQSVEPTYNLVDSKNYNNKDYTANEARLLETGVLNGKESKTYTLKIWIDESVTIEDNIFNKEFVGKISVTSSLTQLAKFTFSDYIIAQSEVPKSGIEKIEHEDTIQTLNNANIDYRYVGSNPDNYVYFGCEGNEESPCTSENLYRIIGVIPTQSSEDGLYENRVKLIKASNWEGSTAQSSSYTKTGKGYRWNIENSNKWESSSLKGILNGEYYASLGEYQEFIAPTKWYLGAPTYNSYTTYTTEQFYTLERSNTKGKSGGEIFYVDNIGLMYPSDYGYSIDGGTNGEVWTSQAIYNNRGSYQYNAWLYNLESKYYEWTMTPESGHAEMYVWDVDPAGYVASMSVYYGGRVLGIRPTFFLKSSVQYKSGDGSIDEPYRIKLNV